MATTTGPSSPSAKTNRVGLEITHYKGNKSTLCAGCGHNAISESNTLARAMFPVLSLWLMFCYVLCLAQFHVYMARKGLEN